MKQNRLNAALVAMLTITSLRADSPMEDSGGSAEEHNLAERYSPSSIRFAPCPEDASLECGELTLPVDYHRPDGETFGLAVIRAKATDAQRRIGILVVNPGGPADSGVNLVLGGIRVPGVVRLRERFDIVSFDVRGSHRSRPVRCEMTPSGAPPTESDGALISFFDTLSQRIARACLDQNGSFITSMSSNTIARDMDVLRRALNERQITYVGYSYGTVLGAAYASQFPRRVRAMLLDAGFPAEFEDYRVEFRSEQAASFEIVFRHVDQLCRRDASCALHDEGVLSTFDEVKQRLESAPVTANGVMLDGDRVAETIASLLPTERAWPEIVSSLLAARGGNYTRLLQVAGAAGSRPVMGASTFDAFTAILCNDYGTRRSAAEYLPISEASGSIYGRVEGRFSVAGSVARCAAWPAADAPVIRNIRTRVENPILLIGNQFDPNTPLNWTRRLAHALGMDEHVVRYEGGGHLAYLITGNPCVDAAGEAYLLDLTLPAAGFKCAALPVSFRSSATP